MPLSVRARVTVSVYRTVLVDGVLVKLHHGDSVGANLVTDAGLVGIHTYVYGTAAQRAAASPTVSNVGMNYIALSNDSNPPAAGDTSLAGELSGNGLSRVQGTVTLPTGSGTITTIENLFTFTGASETIRKVCLFDAASGGRMAHEILLSPSRLLSTGDELRVTFQITLA